MPPTFVKVLRKKTIAEIHLLFLKELASLKPITFNQYVQFI